MIVFVLGCIVGVMIGFALGIIRAAYFEAARETQAEFADALLRVAGPPINTPTHATDPKP